MTTHLPSDPVFPGDSELARRCRALDWGATPLGPVAAWPPSLRTVVALCLTAPGPMCVSWGPELALVYNDAYAAVLGTAKHPGALGHATREVWSEIWAEIWDEIAPDFATVMAGGPAPAREDRRLVIRRDGRDEAAHFSYALLPVRDEAGRVGGGLHVFTETTARVRAEAEARAERERLRALILHMPTPVALLEGPAHRHVLVNGAYRRLSGGGRDVTGRTVRDARGAVFGVLSFGVDFTDQVRARHEAERQAARFGALIEASAQAVWTTDAAGQVVEDSPSWRGFTGQTVAEWLGEGWAAAVHPDDRADAVGQWRAAAAARRPVDTEFRVWHAASGGWRLTRVRATPVYDPFDADGGVREWVGMNVDVTAERAAEAERARLLAESEAARADAEAARAAAELANRAKSEFLATMSHELRTPLNAVAGYTELIELGILGPVTEAQRAALARIDASQRHLLNLLGHAVKFTPPRDGVAGRVEVACTVDGPVEPRPGGGDAPAPARVHLHVRDTGAGIAAEQRERIFEPCVQADQRLTRTREGVGLVLAISRDLARGMGGDLTVGSAVGVGSTFTQTLPAAP